MAMVQNSPSCDRGLMAAVGTLVQAIGQPIAMFMSAFGTDKSFWSALFSQIVPASILCPKLLQKLIQGNLGSL